jgi:chromosomal replication initiator protein
VQDLIQIVADHFGIDMTLLLSTNRQQRYSLPRQVAMYLIKNHLAYTYERIGDVFAGRNHSSVMYACQKLELRARKDRTLTQEIQRIREKIGVA